MPLEGDTPVSAWRACFGRLASCGPAAVAFWNCVNGNRLVLCQTCLDAWFDNADDDPFLEPAGWGWL
jgi:hypothetical protein